MNITHMVTVRDGESGENGETLISHETSLDISHVLNYCKRQEFTIQTVVNDLYHSQSSSYFTNLTGESLSIMIGIKLDDLNISSSDKECITITSRRQSYGKGNNIVVLLAKAGIDSLSRCYSIWMRDAVSLSFTSSLMVWWTCSSMSPILTETEER